jgi:HK97 family phage portal protein
MMTEKQRTSIKDAWMSGRGENTLQILPLGVDYVKLGVASKDAQLLESRGYNTQEITRFFTVPLQLIQAGDKMTYTNLEDLNNIFYQYSLLPFIRSIEEEFTRKFFIDSDYIVDMDEDEFLMRVNKNTLSTYLSTLVGGGIMTVNEARVYLGLKEVEDGDQLHIAYSDASKAQIGNDSEPNV